MLCSMWFGMTVITSLLIALCHLRSLAPRTYVFLSATVVLMCGLHYWLVKVSALRMLTDTAVMNVFPGDRCHWTEEELQGLRLSVYYIPALGWWTRLLLRSPWANVWWAKQSKTVVLSRTFQEVKSPVMSGKHNRMTVIAAVFFTEQVTNN
jgi:hypothetical protein